MLIALVAAVALLVLPGCMKFFSPFHLVRPFGVQAVTEIPDDCPRVVSVEMFRGPNGGRCVMLTYSTGHMAAWCAEEVGA